MKDVCAALRTILEEALIISGGGESLADNKTLRRRVWKKNVLVQGMNEV